MTEPDRGLVANFGLPGSGKTHALRHSVWRSVRELGTSVVVFDRMREWAGVPKDLAGVTTTVKQAGEAVQAANEGARLVIVPGIPNIDTIDALAAWVIAKPNRGMAVPEGHRIFHTNVRLPEKVDEIVSAWRHYQSTLWVDSQRVGRLSRHITENSVILRCFACVGDRDRSVLRDLGGAELDTAVQQAARILGRSGKTPPPPEDAGWHVELRYARTPPFDLVRLEPDGSLQRKQERLPFDRRED